METLYTAKRIATKSRNVEIYEEFLELFANKDSSQTTIMERLRDKSAVMSCALAY